MIAPDPGGADGALQLVAEARAVVAGLSALPHPGTGRTLERWQALAEVAQRDLSLARIVEGHLDAVAILAELESPTAPADVLLGVWAARPEELVAERSAEGWVLRGRKPFCSGSSLLDAALVTATSDDGSRLFLVDAGAPLRDAGSWTPLGMEATRSETMVFEGTRLEAAAAVGAPGAYVERVGFGHGGCGVAACWWGGALGVLDDLRAAVAGRPDDLRLAALGEVALALEAAGAVLRSAAGAIDASPCDLAVAERWATTARSTVAGAAHTALAAAALHLGTSVLGVDRAVTGRLADLTTYLTQQRDTAIIGIGRRVLDEPPFRLC